MLVVGPVWAQGTTGGRQAGGTAYYTFARPGQNTIEVLILGGGRGGMYEIGEDVNLGQLMALAGGAGGGGGSNRTKIKIHLYRVENGGRRKLLEEEIGDFAERRQFPSLQDGDVVRIETRRKIDWRDGLQIASTALSLTFTILTLFDINVR